jgi:ubiquinone/menaquinone biosynthesis C-methylase UbiE
MFTDPIKNVEQLRVRLGSFVADLGSGSGHYAMALARAVGDKGKVFAVDIQKDLLTKLKVEANHSGVSNIDTIWGDVEKIGGSKIKSDYIDDVVISNLLFQVKEKEILAQEAQRILKKDGRLLIIDWSDSFGGLGPKPDSVVV